MTKKTESKTSKPRSPALDEARLAVTTADQGVRDTKAKTRSAKSALKAARKAFKRADKAAKKARKEGRRARKNLKTLLARQAKLKKRPVVRRGSLTKKLASATGPTTAQATVDATSSEILGEHR